MVILETTLTLIKGPTVLIDLGDLHLLTDPTFALGLASRLQTLERGGLTGE